MKAKLNKEFFDIIDTEQKAYWLGFIWSDGYMCIRDRGSNGTLGYEFKLELAKIDQEHLEKFKNDLNSDFLIKNYKNKNSFGEFESCRFMIYNKYFCENLSNNFNLVPRRKSIENFIYKIPKELIRHFIRGIFDADGSFSYYIIHETRKKASMSFNCVENLSRFIESHFIENELIANIDRKLYRRHEERDGEMRTLMLSGVPQVNKILDYLYKDSEVFLDRKYLKYKIKHD